MNMKTIKFLILGSMVIFFIYSCKENEEAKPDKFAMPLLTSRGANTFGCFINGNPFLGDIAIRSIYGSSDQRTSPVVYYYKAEVISCPMSG
jgi:hypothetical protein